ncbi:MAG: TIGR03960 family B12-binding radical SAM protein, partial [Desulforhabdus sp.]|nr:TIGR03960 family B12-binding radical SAM protein [Desulforhabdus sp.]
MDERILYGIEKPGRYLGCEINRYKKQFDQTDVRFALAFPDVYEVGLSHLGLQLLYHRLNAIEEVLADRVYAPWLDFERRLRETGVPLGGIESRRPLNHFDFVGFSLQYELSYTNILTMLDLGKIPLLARDRTTGHHPWVIAGGPCAFNPEPVADFLDFLILGEAEQVLLEVVRSFKAWRASAKHPPRQEFLQEIRNIPGVYIPSFFKIHYHSSGRIAATEPLYADYTKVEKRLIMNLDEDSPIPEKPLVPLLDIVHNRLGVEIARGCTRSCRFCQAGFIYRPVREREPRRVLEGMEMALRHSGFEELSLLSLSTGDYCQIQGLLGALVERFADEKVAMSFPSMRVGTLTPELMELVRRVRKTGFTLAPEAGSERLRRVINKEILDQDLLASAQTAFGLGWRLLKLYFMTGFPTETEEDLDALVNLCYRVWDMAKPSKASINVSLSTFVPKPLTPFQWVPQIPRKVVEERLESLQKKFRRPGLRLKWHHPGHSLLEAVFARGDRQLGSVLLCAWRSGARFDGWTELLREDIWQAAFAESGLDPSFYAQRERALDEVLPWDHLSCGAEKGFLAHEYEQALAEEFTQDCRWSGCVGCGVCDHKRIEPRLHRSPAVEKISSRDSRESAGREIEQHLYKMRYAKQESIRFFGQLEVAQAFSRAVRRTGLQAAYSKGFHPHMKLSFGQALPLGLESLVEELYLTLTEKRDCREVKDLLNEHLPEGLQVLEVEHVSQTLRAPDGQRVTYLVSDLIPWGIHSILQSWTKHLQEPLVKKTKRREITARLG